LEFLDGKLMMGKHQTLRDVTWKNVIDRVGLEKLAGLVDKAKLIAMTNWTMLPFMSDVWIKLVNEVIKKAGKKERAFFVDLADPEKRTAADLLAALNLLSSFQADIHV